MPASPPATPMFVGCSLRAAAAAVRRFAELQGIDVRIDAQARAVGGSDRVREPFGERLVVDAQEHEVRDGHVVVTFSAVEVDAVGPVMPDVVGLPADHATAVAEAALTAAGGQVRFTTVTGDAGPPDRVQLTRPPAGQRVRMGQVVTVVVYSPV